MSICRLAYLRASNSDLVFDDGEIVHQARLKVIEVDTYKSFSREMSDIPLSILTVNGVICGDTNAEILFTDWNGDKGRIVADMVRVDMKGQVQWGLPLQKRARHIQEAARRIVFREVLRDVPMLATGKE